MYDIITLQPEDGTVLLAVNSIAKGAQGIVSAPGENYRLVTVNDVLRSGDGGQTSATIAIVGHGNANGLSGYKTWGSYKQAISAHVAWNAAQTVYLVACLTDADDGLAFLHGNFAHDVKSDLRHATVWASSSTVNARTLTGDWQKVE